jgi:hypothetical protein
VDYRIWFPLIGLAVLMVLAGLHRAGRAAANKRILETGMNVEGQILENRREGRVTTVVYRYRPDGASRPISVERRMSGMVNLVSGPVRTGVLPAFTPVRFHLGRLRAPS